MNLFGYAVGVQEIVLVMTYIQGKNLDDLLFGKDKILSKVCYYNIMTMVFGVLLAFFRVLKNSINTLL